MLVTKQLTVAIDIYSIEQNTINTINLGVSK